MGLKSRVLKHFRKDSTKLVDLTREEADRVLDAGLYEQLYQGPMLPEAKKRLLEITSSSETLLDGLLNGHTSIAESQATMDRLVSKYKMKYLSK